MELPPDEISKRAVHPDDHQKTEPEKESDDQ
jgi:hypothetical protein